MIIKGRSIWTIRKQVQVNKACEHCNSFEVNAQIKIPYYHIFFIPIYAIDQKEIRFFCSHCNAYYENGQLHKELNYQPIPWYLNSWKIGLALVLLPIIIGITMNLLTSNKPNTTASSKEVEKPIISSGQWVSKLFLERLERTKDPLLAQDDAQILIINASNQTLNFIYGLHEGSGDYKIKLNNGNYEYWGEKPDSGDSIKYGQFTFLPNGNIFFENNEYVKFPGEDAAEMVQKLVNRIMEGQYVDSTDSKVEFYSNKQMKGLFDYDTFEVAFDYVGDDTPLPYVFLKNKQVEDAFMFEFSGDTLRLYQPLCGDSSVSFLNCDQKLKGPLKITLIKN
ncbi:MAG: hypothetical protein K2P88_15310 [Chitinophagaceae bacterium]|nr:hypothetical protein [Chitinophagaceae bacterium]